MKLLVIDAEEEPLAYFEWIKNHWELTMIEESEELKKWWETEEQLTIPWGEGEMFYFQTGHNSFGLGLTRIRNLEQRGFVVLVVDWSGFEKYEGKFSLA